MKRFEYSKGYHSDDKLQEIAQGKLEEYDLPEFAKEVPASSSRRESGGTVTIEYAWKGAESPSLKAKRLDFSESEPLENFYKANARDGVDTVCVKHNGHVYILRKTMHEVALALYRASSKLKGALERIVGYLRTLAGNEYVIARVDGDCWSFDRRVAREHISFLELEQLGESGRERLRDMIIEGISGLHAGNLIIGRFTLNNLIVMKDGLVLSDLRKLRVSRKRSLVVDEFKNIMQYLFAIGLSGKRDAYTAVATYAAINEESCNEWYEGKAGRKPKDSLEMADLLEKEIYG